MPYFTVKFPPMQTFFSKARYTLCTLIILAFFLPSYQDISAFNFIPLAFSSADEQSEISSADVFIAVVPLVLIPLSALAIIILTSMRRVIRKTFKALPFICLAIFTFILFLSLRTIEGSGMSSLRTLSHLGVGYYLVAICSVFLPFTKSPYRRKMRIQREMQAKAA
jgi:hypothetical protein